MNERLGNSRTPSLVEVIRAALDYALADVHVAMPGRVVKYEAALQAADVQPLLKRTTINDDASEEVEEIPVLPRVPVVFPRAGGYFLSFPVVPGDSVLLVFNDRSIDNYSASSGAAPVDPVDLRKHDISDAVALVGFGPFAKAIKGDVSSGAVFGKEGGAQVRAKGQTIEITTAGASAASDFVAMSAKVDAIFTLIDSTIKGWTPLANDGGAALKTAWLAAFPSPPASTKSTNLKAD